MKRFFCIALLLTVISACPAQAGQVSFVDELTGMTRLNEQYDRFLRQYAYLSQSDALADVASFYELYLSVLTTRMVLGNLADVLHFYEIAVFQDAEADMQARGYLEERIVEFEKVLATNLQTVHLARRNTSHPELSRYLDGFSDMVRNIETQARLVRLKLQRYRSIQ